MAQNKRFVIWRRSPDELGGIDGAAAIASLQSKITEARNVVEEGDYDTVMVLEIKKIVGRKEVLPPITVKDY